MRRLRQSFALAATWWVVPEIASACSVCTAGREDESKLAFILMTVFLSVLPLTLIGGIAWWVRRRVRAQERLALPRPIALGPERSVAS